MKTEFTVSGFRDLDRALARLAQGVPEERLRAALHEGGELVAAEARRLAPGKTGTLRRSIDVVDAANVEDDDGGRVDLGPATVTVLVGPVGSTEEGDVRYARYKERGTRTQRAQPFMRPAVAAKRPDAERLVTRRIVAEVQDIAREA